ncbi:hypothetical protein LUZ60_012745 [Juncus effusus]|nr:hypothetical protein LUZ60_012745 [Juncus effusus]
MKLLRKIATSITETWLGLGLFLGLLLVLALYLTDISPQQDIENFTVSQPKEETPPPFKPVKETDQEPLEETKIPEDQIPPFKPICDFSDWRYDGCEMFGDSRAMGHENNSIVFFTPPPSQIHNVEAQEWMVRSQSRKIMGIREVRVKSLNSSSPPAPECTVRQNVTALVFATNGFTYNFWHSFSDILVPLFTTSRAFDGEVQFLITDYQGWFVEKFMPIFEALSKYEIIDFDTDREVRCFPHIIVGLRGHKEFGIDPERAPRNYDMFQFRMFMRDTYSLPLWLDIPYKASQNPNKKPRMMLMLRSNDRKFMNTEEIIQTAERVGFEVVPAEPVLHETLTEFAKKVDSCDVLFGAHGAGLTNMVFLRTNAVLVQVVPWGNMKWACDLFLNDPARDMKLRVVEHNITAEESTLYEKYGKDSPEITDPERMEKEGKGAFLYWNEQNLRLNVKRLAPVLEHVLELVKN